MDLHQVGGCAYFAPAPRALSYGRPRDVLGRSCLTLRSFQVTSASGMRHQHRHRNRRQQLADCLRLRGRKQQLLGTLQRRYGVGEEEAARQVEAWEMRSLEVDPGTARLAGF